MSFRQVRSFAAMLVIAAVSACGGKSGLTRSQWQAEVNTCISTNDCAFHAGMMPSQTLPAGDPIGDQIPLDHIVLIMQENRSFDHYFSKLPGVNAPPSDATNPDSNGQLVVRFHQTLLCFPDLSHSWNGAHQELDSGKMDGFVIANDPGGSRAMGYYDQTDLPFYYALAGAFAVSDAHFSSVIGPTWPNRMYYLAATSYGLTENDFPPGADSNGKPYPNVMTELDAAHVTWKAYTQDISTLAIFINTYAAELASNPGRFGSIADFQADAATGNLPQVSFVEASDGSTTYPVSVDEHPPADFQVGQLWLSQMVQAVTTSPEWSKTALFITYDEDGGFYDHVVPPAAVEPDSLHPDSGNGAFNQYGFRVPFLVISPYAKHGYVSHQVTDHTNILKFVETRFGMPAMTNRDANAEPPFDMFDFDHPDTKVPALPPVVVDQEAEQSCIAQYPPSASEF